jgi:hypothetical protein
MREVRFVVQPIVRLGSSYEPDAPIFRTSAVDAEALGFRLARRRAGVVVYEMCGDPEADIWDEPEVIAAYGVAAEVSRGTAIQSSPARA